MNKKWELSNVNKEKVNEISMKYGISEILATIILNREIEEETIEVFLSPTRNDFYDPFLMPDMEKAVDRILKAIKTQEKVIIYGDYDVDGITSITVMKKFLNERGLNVDYYVPNRLDEGYGLNKEALQKIKEDGYTLVITVDCGISATIEVEYANSIDTELDEHPTFESKTKDYRELLLRKFRYKYDNALLDDASVLIKSKRLYNTVMDEPPPHLDQIDPGYVFRNGMMHDIMDDDENKTKWRVE